MSGKVAFSNPKDQVKKWRELNDWIKKSFAKEAIPDKAFGEIEKKVGGSGPQSRIFYGFGNDGKGNADPFLTGHIFVTYLMEKFPNEKSRFIDFYPSPPDPSRFDYYRPKTKMREGAAARPQGFYVKDLLPKDLEEGIASSFKGHSPSDVRKLSPWGWGPEGFEFLAIEPEYVKLLHEKKVPYFVLADYAISPYGEGDFFSTIFLGSDRGRLEFGVTNAKDNIAKFCTSHFA